MLPYSPSPYGYVWEEHDGEAVAVTRDGIAEMVLSTLPGGQIGWAVYDDEGLVERGNFSGMYTEEPQGIYYRADRLLSEFDSNPVIPAKTPGYSEDYTETFPSNFPAPNFMQP